MSPFNKNVQAFLSLVRAGLWEQDIQLESFGQIDFKEVYRLAEEQSVVGLVAAGIEHVIDVKIPQSEALTFVGSALQLEQRNVAMNVFVAKLIDQLRCQDIYAILVKGQGIAQCYERPLWRASGDVDILLSNTNYGKAKEVLVPLALSVEPEYTAFKHLGMKMKGGFEVELHGTLHSRLSRRVDGVVDEAQYDVFYGGNVRSWRNGDTTVYLPAPDVDVIFVFTHILHHFFFEGIGLRQICDWCRLLWTYRDKIYIKLLEKRIRKAGLMTEWKTFAAFAVDWLGMPAEAIPLYSTKPKWKKKAERICADVLKVGNFGHNRAQTTGESQPYLIRKFISFWSHLIFVLRHFTIFPKDSVVFFGGVFRTGLHAILRGE